ncbi:TerB family tellurite resistance protein [Belliella sp. DSM 111904]|uniref:TerB family tellurite resistance protein n=1 Tax=Belliella filtrata TaxID=2923435 RepID=A0ABS9UYZ8_9BACT|nr:TerB family tellurite resistance protein [Belliella filtrata]MCH7408983.1 TerB family tellurite resistance protein [Belliella filtrata]
MKLTTTILLCINLGCGTGFKLQAQDQEVVQLLLNVEKLEQFRGIYRNMLSGYQVLTQGYNSIRDLSQGNFSLHKAFMDGLSQVNPQVRNYRKVGDIVQLQSAIVQTYRRSFQDFVYTGVYSMQELDYLTAVYQNLFRLSLRNLDEVIQIITAGNLTMSDKERLQAIDKIHAETQSMFRFLLTFNTDIKVLGHKRSTQKASLSTLEQLQP